MDLFVAQAFVENEILKNNLRAEGREVDQKEAREEQVMKSSSEINKTRDK